jgi:hypothetical protein
MTENNWQHSLGLQSCRQVTISLAGTSNFLKLPAANLLIELSRSSMTPSILPNLPTANLLWELLGNCRK